jgi:hypothetical protein
MRMVVFIITIDMIHEGNYPNAVVALGCQCLAPENTRTTRLRLRVQLVERRGLSPTSLLAPYSAQTDIHTFNWS